VLLEIELGLELGFWALFCESFGSIALQGNTFCFTQLAHSGQNTGFWL
jgi:hypothetical protein